MKQCFSCHEEVGDRFSFCPVCGTSFSAETAATPPSSVVAETVPAASPSYFSDAVETKPVTRVETAPAAPVASVPAAPKPGIHAAPKPVQRIPAQPTVAETNVAGTIFSTNGNEVVDEPLDDAYLDAGGGDVSLYIHDDDEYHLTMLDDSGLVSRLTAEVRGVARQSQLTWPEFKRDPAGFMKRSATGYGRVVSNFFGNRYIAAAIGVSVLVIAILSFGVWFSNRFSNLLQTLGAKQVGRVSVTQIAVAVLGVLAFGLISATLISWLTRRNTAIVIGGEERDKTAATSGVAVALGLPLVLATAFIFFFFWGGVFQKPKQNPNEDLVVENLVDIPDVQPTPDEGNAGRDKGSGGGSKPKQEKPSGGGGGGREEQTPASQGKLAQANLDIPIIVAPNPKPPPPTKDPLIVPPTMDADPTLFPTDTSSRNFGDPNSKTTATSSGPGQGGGIGDGTGGGVGPGGGGGYGPGNGGNTGGGDRGIGGGGPGGGGGGTDYNKIFNQSEVTQKARILAKPAPEYTEEARVKQTTGTVRLRAVLSSSGQVQSIKPLNQLPYGLTDKAIAACRRIQFSPALKDGRPVSQYVTLEYNFNIY